MALMLRENNVPAPITLHPHPIPQPQSINLTHRGPVTQYGGGSILCKKPYIFHYERIPPN